MILATAYSTPIEENLYLRFLEIGFNELELVDAKEVISLNQRIPK